MASERGGGGCAEPWGRLVTCGRLAIGLALLPRSFPPPETFPRTGRSLMWLPFTAFHLETRPAHRFGPQTSSNRTYVQTRDTFSGMGVLVGLATRTSGRVLRRSAGNLLRINEPAAAALIIGHLELESVDHLVVFPI
jgi:hypothetical protein